MYDIIHNSPFLVLSCLVLCVCVYVCLSLLDVFPFFQRLFEFLSFHICFINIFGWRFLTHFLLTPSELTEITSIHEFWPKTISLTTNWLIQPWKTPLNFDRPIKRQSRATRNLAAWTTYREWQGHRCVWPRSPARHMIPTRPRDPCAAAAHPSLPYCRAKSNKKNARNSGQGNRKRRWRSSLPVDLNGSNNHQ